MLTKIRKILKNPNIELSDLYGTDENNLIGEEVKKYFEPSVFIDVKKVKEEVKKYRSEFYEYRKLKGW